MNHTVIRPLAGLLAAAALFALGFFAASSRLEADAAPLTIEDMKQAVRDTLAEEPEIILQALNTLQQQVHDASGQAGQGVKEHLEALVSGEGSPVVGNPEGDVTVVEFFDYHCGYCKRIYPDIARLIAEDKNVRVVMKEFPILGEGSMTASKAALAVHALAPDKYFEYHGMLMEHRGEYTGESVAGLAAKIGVEAAALKTEMDSPGTEKKIQDAMELGRKIGAQGTPTLVIGEEKIPGAIGYDALKAKVAALRN